MKIKLAITLLGCSFVSFAQPSVISLSPLNGNTTSATFTSVYRHPGGINQQFYLAYLLVLPTPNIVQYTAKGSCLVEYNRISKGVRLINDAGDNWLGRLEGEPAGPGGTVLTNSRCTVDTRNVSAAISGNDLTVTVPLTMFGTMTGQMGTFLQGFDVNGNFTGMTQFGNWTAYPIATPKPGPYVTNVQVFPAGYTLAPSRIVVDTGNTTGIDRIALVNVLIAEQIVGGTVRCHIFYVPATKELKLINDAGTGTVPDLPQRQNGYCAVGSFPPDVLSVSGSGNDLHLNIPVVWNTPTLTKKLFVWANTFDNIGNLTHWLQ